MTLSIVARRRVVVALAMEDLVSKTITLETWRARMSEDMRLRDFRSKTQASYLLVVRLFLEWLKKEPDTIADDDVRRYFLYLREDRNLAPSSIHVTLHGLRFFFIHTMHRDWAVLNLLRVKKPRKLPVVLSHGEVRQVLSAVEHPVRRVALTTIYALGLRLGEGLSLETDHIDSERLLVWVRDGKGAKDRAVPLPRPLLRRLREYWKTERPTSPTKFLFVPTNGDGPLHETTLQKTFSAALSDSRVAKAATVHTLRHSYATHLLEAGISLKTIQQILGHSSLRTTAIYTHVTKPAVEHLQETLDRIMRDL